MPSVEELSVAAVRSAMAPGYELDAVAAQLTARARRNVTALKLARARVERGGGWRSGPIGLRAREALSRAIELCEHPAAEVITDIDLTDTVDLTDSSELSDSGRHTNGPLHA
jgi:hypothetical protein